MWLTSFSILYETNYNYRSEWCGQRYRGKDDVEDDRLTCYLFLHHTTETFWRGCRRGSLFCRQM
nr:MAG TPA: hypothetical protein [Caudoviricetes sp.]